MNRPTCQTLSCRRNSDVILGNGFFCATCALPGLPTSAPVALRVKLERLAHRHWYDGLTHRLAG